MVRKNMKKKVLIIDEKVFAHVCRAVLELEGNGIEIHELSGMNLQTTKLTRFGLIITSYPFCIPLLNKLREFDMPKIILFDNLNEQTIVLLKSLTKAFCMIKPIDYSEFRSLVRKIMWDTDPAYLQSVNIL
jgi:hypothetical protein